jgi:uncharacterized tellurite resistance protein B-like protein
MPIEALYPYAIMTYSAFVTILAVYLWKLTNLNVDGTRSNIEKQVATAVVDIKGQVVEMKTQVNEALANADFKAVSAQLDDLAENIPDFDQDALMQRLDRLEVGLPDMIGTHISMAIKGIQATEGKAIAKYVEELGIEGLTAEAQEAAVERLTTKQRLAYQLMTMKVPSKTKREHPVSTMVFEQSRGLVAQQLIESDQQGGNVRIENGSGYSEGHRPGLRR